MKGKAKWLSVLAVASYLVYQGLTSIWTLKALLPNDAVVVAGDLLLEARPFFVSDRLPNTIFDNEKVKALGFSFDQQQVVLVPQISQRRLILQVLSQSGWQLHDWGVMIQACQGQCVIDIQTSLRYLLRIALLEFAPWHPVVIAEVNSNSTRQLAIGVIKQGELRFIEGLDWKILSERSGTQENIKIGSLDAAMPGDNFTYLPDEIKVSLNQYLLAKMGFRLYSAKIIEHISQYDQASIMIDKLNAGIGVRGSPGAFEDVVKDWITLEDITGRPINKAFRLPDGSLGHEKVPGQAEAVWKPYSGICREPMPGKMSLWFCMKDDRAAVATDKKMAENFINNNTSNSIYVFANREIMSCEKKSSVWCRIESLSVRGSEGRIGGIIKFIE